VNWDFWDGAFQKSTAETEWAGWKRHSALYEIAKVHTSWRLSISGNCWGPAMTINEWGTEEQKQKYIPDLVSGKQ
jgi:glutaryl-CoA dehydrogenase (non-decarboxylating)